MSYAVFQCHTEGCTVMIRCPVGMVSQASHQCKWCQVGTAYYADGSLKRSILERKGTV